MTDRLTIVLAQINPIVGDIPGNLAQIMAIRDHAAHHNADLVVFSELMDICRAPAGALQISRLETVISRKSRDSDAFLYCIT